MLVAWVAAALGACLLMDDPEAFGSMRPGEAGQDETRASADVAQSCELPGPRPSLEARAKLRPQIEVSQSRVDPSRIALHVTNRAAFEPGADYAWSFGDGSLSQTLPYPHVTHTFLTGPKSGEREGRFVVEVAVESGGQVYVGSTCVKVDSRGGASLLGRDASTSDRGT